MLSLVILLWPSHCTNFLEQIFGKHEDLHVRPEALYGSEIANSLFFVIGRRHDFKNIERGPRHVVAEHFEICELQQGRSLEAHVLAFDFLATFSNAGLNVFLLVAFLVPESSNEVVEGFFEPA